MIFKPSPFRILASPELVFVLLFACLPAQLSAQDKIPVIWKVSFEGNNAYENMVLAKYIATEAPAFRKKIFFRKAADFQVNETEIKRDVIRLERFYERRGFPEAEVSYRLQDLEPPRRKELIFTIKEGPAVTIRSVYFNIDAPAEDSLLIKEDKALNKILQKSDFIEGKRLKTVNTDETAEDISEAMRNLGYPWAGTKITAEIDTLNRNAVVTYSASPGMRARFDSVLVEGESSLPEKYIIRETGIKKGTFYNEKSMRDAQRELFNHHLFRFAIVSVPEQPQDSTINILVRVKERPLRSFQFTAGAGNFDRIEPPIDSGNFYRLLRGEVVWIYRNARQKGERFRTSLRASGFEQNFGFDYLFPYVFNTKSSFITTPFIQHRIERAYEILRGGVTSNFIYEYDSNLTGFIGYEYSDNREFSHKSRTSLPDSVLTYSVSSIRLNAYYSKGLRGEVNGWVFQPAAEFSGTFRESSYQFQKLSVDARRYTQINETLELAARINAGTIFSAEKDSLPKDIKFYTGGTNSVRGWGRANLGPKEAITDSAGTFIRYIPLGGNAFANFNVELRQQIPFIKGLGLAAFLDGGQVWETLSAINLNALQFGTGGGIRYQSPIGPIRLDIAYKLNPSSQDLNIYQGNNFGNKWTRWGFHLSIGQAF